MPIDSRSASAVLGEKAGPAIAEPLGERRRAFDVREEQGDVPDGSSNSGRAYAMARSGLAGRASRAYSLADLPQADGQDEKRED